MSNSKFENELKIIRAIYEWSYDSNLEIDFAEQLLEFQTKLTSDFGRIQIKTPAFHFEVHVHWLCPICDADNEFVGNQEDVDYYDECPTCGLEVDVREG